MKTHDCNRPHLCRSPKLTPARLAACRANARKSTGPRTVRGKARSSLNALKHGRYARRLTRTLEQAGEREQLRVYWGIVSRISQRFQVDWKRERQVTERLARQVWCYGWKTVERMKTNRRCARNSGSYENNLRFPIRIEGNARGRALRFVFGQRRRRRLTARVIPLVPQTAAVAVCGRSSSPRRKDADRRNGGPRDPSVMPTGGERCGILKAFDIIKNALKRRPSAPR